VVQIPPLNSFLFRFILLIFLVNCIRGIIGEDESSSRVFKNKSSRCGMSGSRSKAIFLVFRDNALGHSMAEACYET
jgi:hypothetical protein